MKLSVVIPSREGHARLPETVRALGEAPAPDGGAEIIVVDDASRTPIDGNALTGASPHPLRVLRLDRNRGRAGACNAGIEAALGEFVLILDDDMSIDAQALRGHVAAHHGMETGSARGVLGQIVPDLASYRGRYARFLVAEERERHRRLAQARTRLRLTDFSTAFFSAPRELLARIGGFDEAFSRYGFEDLELGARLLAAGVRLIYRQELTALHRSVHAGFALACRRHLESGEMAVVFAERHRDPGIAAHLRVTGMSPREERTRFRRLLAAAHQLTRRTPAPLRPLPLLMARMLVRLGELLLPDRPLHVLYHVVRDMHYAAGIEQELEVRRR